jgi:hypothetical protein
VVVNFESGTTRQRALFQQAIDRSIFPWDRITTHVHVAFASVVPGGHHRFAATQWGIAPDLLDMDICGRPDEATAALPVASAATASRASYTCSTASARAPRRM